MKTTKVGYSWINVRNKQKYNEAIEVNYLAAQALLHTLFVSKKNIGKFVIIAKR